MHILKLGFGCCLLLAMAGPTHAQMKLLKKVANTANSVLNNAGNSGNNTPPPNTQQGDVPGQMPTSGGGNGRPTNKTGQGLVSTPPDVAANLTASEAAFKNKNYAEARHALQQAMLGVELEIGQAILKSLPETMAGLPKQQGQDFVGSSGWGWTGLTIKREYLKGEQMATVTISNNAAMMQGLNMFLTSGLMPQTLEGEQNMKQTRFKGNKAVIGFEADAGYTLSVPFGISTLLAIQGVNFATEADFIKAAEAIDLDKIKTLLNEKQ